MLTPPVALGWQWVWVCGGGGDSLCQGEVGENIADSLGLGQDCWSWYMWTSWWAWREFISRRGTEWWFHGRRDCTESYPTSWGRREEYRDWRREEGGLPPVREDKGGSQCQGGRGDNCSTGGECLPSNSTFYTQHFKVYSRQFLLYVVPSWMFTLHFKVHTAKGTNSETRQGHSS